MPHVLTLMGKEPVTHNVHRFTFNKPEGFEFRPGQATELTLLREGWKDESRPFTFTSLPTDPTLEFTIKSYPSHDGVTEQLGTMELGEQAEIGDAWGAIEDRGPGAFLAGGAGVTPFIAILKNRLQTQGSLDGTSLHFANSTEADIIHKDMWPTLSGLEVHHILSDEEKPEYHHGQIDKDYLKAQGIADAPTIYLCGPPPMEEAVKEALMDLGVSEDRIVRES